MGVKANKNKYCDLNVLRNESDVEHWFILPLLADLGYGAEYVATKATISEKNIGKRSKPRPYRPDFICYADKQHKQPVLIIDAKHPKGNVEDGIVDAQLYAAVLRRGLTGIKPDQYCMGSNGCTTVVREYDSDRDSFNLDFSEFEDGNIRFTAFRNTLTRSSLVVSKTKPATSTHFEFKKPPIPSLLAIFEACHNLIWRREKCPPADAFYEFVKILFVKLRKDRDLHQKSALGPLSPEDVEVSVHWIESLEPSDPNPFNTVLFANLREALEDEYQVGTKKRMFDPGEEITLKPSTTKEVVRLLEHLNLHSIDEDLNGRMFETFLTAVIRGRSLGQYFTPRTVVKFMVDLANLSVTAKRVPRIIDACCGTGGFLIEALARLTDSVAANKSLTRQDRERLLNDIRMERLWGIEAHETIARVARINMYLHQDGGSRIYKTDSLDKEHAIEPNVTGRAARDFEELKKALVQDGITFDVALTNPPFAMRYESKKEDERKILKQYVLARIGAKGSLAASLRSSILFLERYYDLLRDKGLLFTIIDDSVLNTTTAEPVRKWLRQHFYIRAIISLPKNCFVVAGSASKTSILMLEKKAIPSDDQPSVFMAKSKNVGHTDSGKPDLVSNDLGAILTEWTRFRDSGTPPTREGCFLVTSEKLLNRFDLQWYDPEYIALYEKLEKVSHFHLRDLKPELKYGASIDADYTSDVPFLRIENLRRNDIDVSDLQFVSSALYLNELKKLFLREGDILVARSGTYVGLCAMVGSGMEKYVYGSYMIRLRLKDHNRVLPRFLALYLNSRFGQMQFDRVKTGSLQFNINQQQIGDIIIPEIPIAEQERIITEFSDRLSRIKRTRQDVAVMEAEFADGLGSKVAAASGLKGQLRLRDFTGE
jgi:type I restriction enzyme M protein